MATPRALAPVSFQSLVPCPESSTLLPTHFGISPMHTMPLSRAECSRCTMQTATDITKICSQLVTLYMCPARTFRARKDKQANYYQNILVHSECSKQTRAPHPTRSSCPHNYGQDTFMIDSTRASSGHITLMMIPSSCIGKGKFYMTSALLMIRSGL